MQIAKELGVTTAGIENRPSLYGKKRLGANWKTDSNMVSATRFMDLEAAEPPKNSNHWKKRKGFPLVSFGNKEEGCCGFAKQARAMMQIERIEVGKTAKITTEEVHRVYRNMTARLYGGGDTGVYEDDALSNWRRPDLTFKDTKGRALTIDAFARIPHYNKRAVMNAIAIAGAKGIAFCMSLPIAFMDKTTWDIPEGQLPKGIYEPGSWGGHSMWTDDYRTDENGVVWFSHPTTWEIPDIEISERAWLMYARQSNLIIDSFDYWRKIPGMKKKIDLEGLKKEVNKASGYKIK